MIVRALILASIFALTGACTGAQKVSRPDISGDPADLDAPSSETLATAPCGNPDWSKLPEGSDPPEQ